MEWEGEKVILQWRNLASYLSQIKLTAVIGHVDSRYPCFDMEIILPVIFPPKHP